ncbi:MAG: hypothetical protein JWP74_3676 [Marmoricola sp.]|nr:hypothetical protein [Marmoricola sp.]
MLENLKTRAAVLGVMFTGLMVGSFALAGGSFADGTDPVSADFTTLQGDVTTYGGAILALVLVSAGIFLGIKYLRKGISKA